MIYKLTIHLSIILTACFFANEFNFFGIKIELYQSFLIILISFHLLFKIHYIQAKERFLNKGITISFRFWFLLIESIQS